MGHALRAGLEGDPAALEPAATFADGLRIQQVIEAIRHSSAHSGDWVELEPPVNTFADEQASAGSAPMR
jgi:predicted dehydrogenase